MKVRGFPNSAVTSPCNCALIAVLQEAVIAAREKPWVGPRAGIPK